MSDAPQSLRRSVLVAAPAAADLALDSAAPADILWRPTEAQVRVKSKFWSKWAVSPMLHGKEPSKDLIRQLTSSVKVDEWWERPGFKEWFLNSTSNDDRLQWLVHLALNAAQDLLLSDDSRNSTARAAMIRLVLDLATRGSTGPAGTKQAAKSPIDSVAELSKEQLVELVNANKTKDEPA